MTCNSEFCQLRAALHFHQFCQGKEHQLTISMIEQVCPGACFECPHSFILHVSHSRFFLFQMLQDCAKARREVELHWRASPCANIVRIIDVYENLYQGRKCLLIVMEW